MTDIHEIVDPNAQSLWLLWLGFGVLGLWVLLRLYQHWLSSRDPVEVRVKPTFSQSSINLPVLRREVLRELENLRQKLQTEPESDFTPYFFQVSRLLRQFAGPVFRLPALSMTKAELRAKLSQEYQILMEEILSHCYTVEFTPNPGTRQDVLKCIQQTVSFIHSCPIH
jgi:hypothetical protein